MVGDRETPGKSRRLGRYDSRAMEVHIILIIKNGFV